MKKHLLAGSALALAFASHTAMAQDTSAPDPVLADQPQDEAESGVTVITITAQRREETLQDAALAINAATGEDLIQAGVVDASQLNKIAPALYVATGGGANVGYFVRGVGNFVNNGFTNPAV